MNAEELKTTPKISVKIWRPIIGKLDSKIEAACLRRDAYLRRVLSLEIERLDEEVAVPNSHASYDYVFHELDQLDRKLVSLALPLELTARLNDVCKSKNIVRDAFFNRLFLLLAAEPAVIDALYFGGESDWRRDVWSEFKVDGPFMQNGFHPLDPDIDPFWALRAAHELLINQDVDVEDFKTSAGKTVHVVRGLTGGVEPLPSIYTTKFSQRVQGHSLVGLSCYLPDWDIPGHAAQKARTAKLDEILSDLLGPPK